MSESLPDPDGPNALEARVVLLERAAELIARTLVSLRAEIDAVQARDGDAREAELSARVERLGQNLALLRRRVGRVTGALGMAAPAPSPAAAGTLGSRGG